MEINSMESKKYLLDNWSTTTIHGYQALQGEVYGHESHEDGTFVLTSIISSVSDDGTVTTIHGSDYALGEVDPVYEEQYPDAKERLIQAWSGV